MHMYTLVIEKFVMVPLSVAFWHPVFKLNII